MSRRGLARATSAWVKAFNRNLRAATRASAKVARVKVPQVPKVPKLPRAAGPRKVALATPAGPGDWMPGLALQPGGARRYRLYRPPGLPAGEKRPLLVMLHGCDQDSADFAASTRMNALARREGFLVLYPEQDRLANPQRCWNWYDTRNGRAQAEVALILAAIDQVCTLYAVDRSRIALVGLSAGAGMAALLATRHPERFRAVVMHSGVAPGVAQSTATALSAMRGGRRPAPHDTEAALKDWPPLLVIQGGRDTVVSPRNGVAVAQMWAESVGAGTTAPRAVQRGQRHAMTVTSAVRDGHTRVTLVEVPELGHAWSGGAARQRYSDAKGPDASRMAWAFASRAFRRL